MISHEAEDEGNKTQAPLLTKQFTLDLERVFLADQAMEQSRVWLESRELLRSEVEFAEDDAQKDGEELGDERVRGRGHNQLSKGRIHGIR